MSQTPKKSHGGSVNITYILFMVFSTYFYIFYAAPQAREKFGQNCLITDTSQTPKKSHTRYFGSQNDYVIVDEDVVED